MKITPEIFRQVQDNLGNQSSVIDQSPESFLSDPNIESINLVGDHSKAVILVAKHKGSVDVYKHYQAFGNLPVSTDENIALGVFNSVFTDRSPGMPSNGRSSTMVTFDAVPSELGWTAEIFAQSAVNNGYDISNPSGLMTSPAAEIAVEHKPGQGDDPETSTISISIRSPQTRDVNGISCQTADIQTIEISVSGNLLPQIKELLANGELESEEFDPDNLCSWGQDSETVDKVIGITGKIKEMLATHILVEKEETHCRIIATKTPSKRVNLGNL